METIHEGEYTSKQIWLVYYLPIMIIRNLVVIAITAWLVINTPFYFNDGLTWFLFLIVYLFFLHPAISRPRFVLQKIEVDESNFYFTYFDYARPKKMSIKKEYLEAGVGGTHFYGLPYYLLIKDKSPKGKSIKAYVSYCLEDDHTYEGFKAISESIKENR